MMGQDEAISALSFTPTQILSNTNVTAKQNLERVPPPILVEELLESQANARAGNESDEEEEFGDPELILESGHAYAWEGGYDRTWDRLRETDGRLDATLFASEKIKKKERDTKAKPQVRKGTIRVISNRNLMILLDLSEATKEVDFKPDRLTCAITLLEEFFETFFQFNPLAAVGIVAMLHSQAVVVSQLGGNPEEKIERLIELRSRDVAGGPCSLLNGLERGLALLSTTPPYGTRELLVIFGSIKTCDAGDINEIIDKLKEKGVRTSVVSFAPELYILKKISQATDGRYFVCRTREEVKESLITFRVAPNWNSSIETRLVPMGFPQQLFATTISLCICHNRPSMKGYLCPRCHCKVCELPTKCKSCQLHLASGADIARTSQHLTPAPASVKLAKGSYLCRLCNRYFSVGGATCLGCEGIFCHACDIFRADVLQQCPTCVQRQEIERRQCLAANHETMTVP